MGSRSRTAFVAMAIVSMRPTLAHAQPTVQAKCSEAYLAAQHLMHDRRLLDARTSLLVCARDPCSRALQPECAQWLADVQRALPSVVILAQSGGVELRDVHVSVDGHPLLEHLDGTSTDLDPGMHSITLVAASAPPVIQSVLIHEGEHSRVLHFDLSSPAAAPLTPASPGTTTPSMVERAPDVPKRAITWPVYVFGSTALVGAVGWTYFGLSGLSLRSEINASPSANASSKPTLNVDWAMADASIGVTVLSVALATYFFFRPIGGAEPSPKTALPQVMPVFGPRTGGGSLGVYVRF